MNNIPVYLINLDTDKDRLEFMDGQLKALNINYERFPAIYGTQLPGWLKPYFLDDDGNIASRLTAGEVGCYASHMAIMKRVAAADQPALVLEDDIQIKPEFPALVAEFLRSGLSCDILRISSYHYERKNPTRIVASLSNGYDVIKYMSVPNNTGAYLITPEGARKFLKWKPKRTTPIDQDLKRIWDLRMKTLAFCPPLVIHNVLEVSTIHTMGKPSGSWRRPKLQRMSDRFFRRLYYYYA